MDITADRNLIENNHDVLDAVVCILAGMDFLVRDVIAPLQTITDLSINSISCRISDHYPLGVEFAI